MRIAAAPATPTETQYDSERVLVTRKLLGDCTQHRGHQDISEALPERREATAYPYKEVQQTNANHNQNRHQPNILQ